MELNLKNLPRVAVHDIVVHPRDNDLILATHGRSLWVFDDATPIQQMTESVLESRATLFDIRPAYRFAARMSRYGVGDKIFRGPNPPAGAIISYYLKEKPDAKTPAKMEVFDANGRLVVEIKNFPKEKGLNRAVWNLSFEGARQRRLPTPEQLEFFGAPRGPQVLPGIYTVRLTVGDSVQEKRVEVRVDPTVKITPAELQSQLEQAIRLRDLVSPINDGLRALDSIRQQLEQIERTGRERLGELPADVTKAIENYRKKLNDTSRELAADPEDDLRSAARFADRLNNLYFSISGGNFAPTAAMRENFETLRAEAPKVIEQINRVIVEDTRELNQTLQKNGLATIVAGRPVEPPK